jgi:oxygen-independent coproporphyrinogen-3 oxidase
MKGCEIMAAGLYFHIPFCRSKCPYCSFYSVKYDEKAAEEYAAQVCDEIKKYTGSFDTVYFGGGTPSVLKEELLAEILDAAKEQFDIDKNAEITVECNPSAVRPDTFEKYAAMGVNRISLGMQSAVDGERFALGRAAGRREVAAAVNAAKAAGITNISLDVMLGIPKQTLQSLDETFDFIAGMNVTHVSAYMLKIEEGTRFFDMRERLALPDEDEVCDMYLKTAESLKALGFEQYEISNFAKPGFESRHNLKYWTLEDYLGIGKTAHSLIDGRRFYYDEDFRLVEEGAGATESERIMLGLRLNRGIDKSLVKKDYSQFVRAGLMTETDKKIALTTRGMLVSNVIIGELL